MSEEVEETSASQGHSAECLFEEYGFNMCVCVCVGRHGCIKKMWISGVFTHTSNPTFALYLDTLGHGEHLYLVFWE